MADPIYDEDQQGKDPYQPKSLRAIPGGGESTPERANLRSVPTAASEDAATDTVGGIKPKLSAIQGGRETTPGRGNLKAVPNLNDAENTAAGQSDNGGQSKQLSPGKLQDAEDNTPWGGLWKDYDPKSESLKTKIKGTFGRRKIFAALGVGGIVGLFLAVITAAPVFRVPSLMDGIMGFVGEQVEDVVEHRAQRVIISYLIQRVGGNPDNYVIRGSLTDSLWETFRVRKVENTIKYDSGYEIIRGNDGLMHLHYYEPNQRDPVKRTVSGQPKDLGVIESYDDVFRVVQSDPKALKDFTKIAKILLPAYKLVKFSDMKKTFDRRYLKGRGFVAPQKDPSLTDAENQEAAKKTQIDVVTDQNIDNFKSALNCLEGVRPEDCAAIADQDQPTDTTRPPPEGQATSDLVDEFSREAEVAKTETRDLVAKTGESFTAPFKKKLVSRILIAATGVGLLIDGMDLLSVANHYANQVADNPELYKAPSYLAGNASAAMYSQWLGFGDNIKAGRMALLYIAMFNKQVGNAADAVTHEMTFNGKVGKGVPPDFRIDSDATYPSQAIMSFYRTYNPGYIVGNAVLETWFITVHPLIDIAGEWADTIIGFLTNNALERILAGIFGENWQEEAAVWAVETLTAFLGGNIDPLATGAKWMNQVFVGGQVALNNYCASNLGCRALTPLIEKGIFDTPLFYNSGSNYVSEDDRRDMALLPLKDRLFSIDEPHSLINETFRAFPSNHNPVDWLRGTLSQVATIPGNLVTSVSGRTSAATITLEQQAAVAGVQIMGGTAEDFSKDLAAEVRQMPKDQIVCPPNDPQVMFNTCQADKVVNQSLMCLYAECPQSLSFGEPGSSYDGFIANLKQIWSPRQGMGVSLW